MQNAAEVMDGVPEKIQIRVVARFYQADKGWSFGIADEKAVLAEVER